ncbi:MAG: ferric reductase-like transmembrane domain-containing protein [Rhodospirillales bacterium]|nr:ferric reductase-like transmembrane domain-containing protein [Rhodospirillales bacterium]
MRPLGLILILLAVIFPFPYYVELFPRFDNEALFSHYLGSIAIILMAISQLISTRFPGIQLIFGGLDQVYLLHKWIGIFAVSAMMLHDTIDAEIKGLGRETWLADIAEESGEIALYGLLILGMLSLITFIPYELWKKTHKFIGAFFVLSAFHYLYILKPFTLLDPLGLYIMVFCILGLVCYIYMLVFSGFVDRPSAYKVANTVMLDDTVELSLQPIGKGIKHKAGQFAFLEFNGEKHPFTIACGPNSQREIKFCVKALGDFSRSLGTELKVGDRVSVSRPFGHFTLPKAKTQCWIAGGIGITPFLAWAETLKPEQDKTIHLFYCIRSVEERVPFVNQLKQSNVSLHIIDSAKGQRLNARLLEENLGTDLKNVKFSFCGPKAMRKALQNDFKLSYEEFEMRSGTEVSFLATAIKWCIAKILILKRI